MLMALHFEPSRFFVKEVRFELRNMSPLNKISDFNITKSRHESLVMFQRISGRILQEKHSAVCNTPPAKAPHVTGLAHLREDDTKPGSTSRKAKIEF